MNKEFRSHLRRMRSEKANNQRIISEAPPTSALGQLHAIAKTIRAQRPLLSEAQAFGQAMLENPHLYEQYEEERGA